MRDAWCYNPRDGGADHRSAVRAHDLAPRHRSRRSQGPVRLHEHNYVAYLVGGSVRDLLLGRRPKDFDIGTSAHPHQVKKLFRNCWIIGRRFRLAHVKFGTKTIEVATFRRQVEPHELTPEIEVAAVDGRRRRQRLATPSPRRRQIARKRHDARPSARSPDPPRQHLRHARGGRLPARLHGQRALLRHRHVLDHRLRRRPRGSRRAADPLHRRPDVRFLEDPVRMLRAVVLAARLEFTIDEPILDAIDVHRHEIARSAPARLLEEYFKILRSGHAEEALAAAARHRAAEGDHAGARGGARGPLALDRRARSLPRTASTAAPDTLTNAILAGTLLHPLGLIGGASASPPIRSSGEVELGMLPIPRRDVERLQQIIAMQPRLLDIAGARPRPARPAAPRRPRRGADLARDPRRPPRRRRALARAARPRPASASRRSRRHGRRRRTSPCTDVAAQTARGAGGDAALFAQRTATASR